MNIITKNQPVSALKEETYRYFLKSIPLFSELDDTALSHLLANISIREYSKGSMLFLMGDKIQYFYIIFNGWIKLFRETCDGHEHVIDVLTHKNVFGRTAVLRNNITSYSAQALTNTSLLMIPTNFMQQMFEQPLVFNGFTAKFLEGELNKASLSELEAEHLTQMTSAQRVGCFLLRLSNHHSSDPVTIQLPYEKALVAGRLGMTPETFSRALQQLSTYGVETINSHITLHTPKKLQSHICPCCSALKAECLFSMNEDDDEALKKKKQRYSPYDPSRFTSLIHLTTFCGLNLCDNILNTLYVF